MRAADNSQKAQQYQKATVNLHLASSIYLTCLENTVEDWLVNVSTSLDCLTLKHPAMLAWTAQPSIFFPFLA